MRHQISYIVPVARKTRAASADKDETVAPVAEAVKAAPTPSKPKKRPVASAD